MHHPKQQLHLSPHAIQPSKAAEQQLTWQHTFSSHADVSAHIRPAALPKAWAAALPKNLHSSISLLPKQQHMSFSRARQQHLHFLYVLDSSNSRTKTAWQQGASRPSQSSSTQSSSAARPRQQQLPSRLQHLTAWTTALPKAWTAAFLFSPTSNTCSSSPIPTAYVKSHPSCAGSNVLEHKNTNTSLEF
jgi:hypothetical protein